MSIINSHNRYFEWKFDLRLTGNVLHCVWTIFLHVCITFSNHLVNINWQIHQGFWKQWCQSKTHHSPTSRTWFIYVISHLNTLSYIHSTSCSEITLQMSLCLAATFIIILDVIYQQTLSITDQMYFLTCGSSMLLNTKQNRQKKEGSEERNEEERRGW